MEPERGDGRVLVLSAAVLAVAFVFYRALRSRRTAADAAHSRHAIAQARAHMRSAAERGDVAGCALGYAAEAVAVTQGGAVLAGRTRIAAAMARSLADGRIATSEVISTARAADAMVLEEGAYRFDFVANAGSTVSCAGRFAAVWKRERDGWKIVFEDLRSKTG